MRLTRNSASSLTSFSCKRSIAFYSINTMHKYLLIEYKGGFPRKEPVHAEHVGEAVYQLQYSPGFVLGIAACDMFRIPKDATNRAPVSNMKSIKEVMGVKRGTISFGMGMRKEDGMSSYLGVKEVK